MGKKKGKGGKKKKKTTWGCQNCSSANTLEATSCTTCGEIRETSTTSNKSATSSSTPTRSYQEEALAKYTKCLASIEDLSAQNSLDPNVVQMLQILETQKSIYKDASEKIICNIPTSIPRPVLVALSTYRGMLDIYKELGRPMPRIPKAKKK